MSSFPLRIAGVGASSGGLDPIIALLSRIPLDSGLALLIVQHLDPSQPSLLVSILAQRTAMTVLPAADGLEIQAGHVYVIEPNTTMSVEEGRLRIAPRGSRLGPPMPIDDLLESLARDREGDAIGIVLSGAGTDGALGLQAIKAFGGLTFAQDETTARFFSMPRAAIGLGCVDRVLAPERIADELLRIARHPALAVDGGDAASPQVRLGDEDGLRALFHQLRAVCRIDFSHYKRGTIQRRVARRLALRGADDLAGYQAVLDVDPAEVHALCRDLLIRYTEFFRDPEAFDALRQTALPRLLQTGDLARPLRVWIPGCATGEEVYSIAICLAEYITEHGLGQPVQIFGTDVSDDALQVARTGRYIENIARNVSAERLARFFVREGDHYRVTKAIRDCCTFARQNVAYDPPFSRLDLISCRNLLIYLDPVLQRRVMPAFHFALQRDGLLLLGASESVGAGSEFFAPVDTARAKLFEKKPAPARPFSALATARVQAPPPVVAPRPEVAETDPADGMRREVDRILLARFTPPCVVCDEAFNVVEYRGDTSAFLVNPPGAPTNQLQRLARPGVFVAVSDAVREARSSGGPAQRGGVRTVVDGKTVDARVEVVPVPVSTTQGRWFLVTFVVQPAAAAEGAPVRLQPWVRRMGRWLGGPAPEPAAGADDEIRRLTAELDATRAQARTTLEEHEAAIEELKTLEEETQSSNEEYQSTNEELETAKEELQSLNEELSTTNDELRFRNRELKTLHEQVTQARDFADAIIETMSQPMLVLDPTVRVVRANQAFYDGFQTTPRDTLQVSLYALGSGQWNIPELRRLLEDLLPNRDTVRNHEVTVDCPAIGRRTMLLNAARLLCPDSTTMLLTIEDVTERQATLQALSDAARQKDDFLAVLAHELRNPLAGMSNALRLWRHPKADAAQRDDAVALLARQLRNQVRLVEDLLDVSRITRGLVELKRSPVDLAQVVRQACQDLQGPIDAREHDLRLVLPDEPLVIDGDRLRLEQVVGNLVSNAVKYTPAHGRLEVRLERDAADVVLTVADNGVGMEPRLLREVFDLFVRGDAAPHLDIGGLGIGLAIVKRIVELHGGSVRAESDGPTRGSRFVVRLPGRGAAARQEAALPEEAVRSVALPSTAARRVLVLDDDVDAGESLASLLALEGLSVRVRRDGPAALAEAARWMPDAAVVDLGLPGEMDGYEFCRRLRRIPGLQALHIIVVSGFSQPRQVEAAHVAGADRHLTKPADALRVAELVRRGRPVANEAPAAAGASPPSGEA